MRTKQSCVCAMWNNWCVTLFLHPFFLALTFPSCAPSLTRSFPSSLPPSYTHPPANKQVEANLPPSLITLLSPYAAQVSLLSSLLHPRWPDLQIGTVDSMQGRENEVVVISLVRSNEKGEVGFLGEKRRLNV